MSRFSSGRERADRLVDTQHVMRKDAHAWFDHSGKRSWATCPITENGLLRVVGHSRHPNSPGTPAAMAELLAGLRASKNHEFWPDDISLLDDKRIDSSRMLDSSQIADTYLLALASAHRGTLATFDRRLVTYAVIGGWQALHLIA